MIKALDAVKSPSFRRKPESILWCLLSFSHRIPTRGRSSATEEGAFAAPESGTDETDIWRRPYLSRPGERTSGRKAKDKGENGFRLSPEWRTIPLRLL